MTRKSTYIFSGVIYFIFFTSLLYFFISIGSSIKGEKSKAAFSFNSIVQEINDYINTSYQTDDFDLNLISSNYKNLKTLKIEKNNNIYYEYHSSDPEANKISTTKVYSKTIPYINNTTAVLTAEYQILKPETIYNSAKKIFFIILITTIITLILIIISKKDNTAKTVKTTDIQNIQAPDSDYEWNFNQSAKDKLNEIFENSTNNLETINYNNNTESKIEVNNSKNSIEKQSAEIIETSNKEPEENLQSVESFGQDENQPDSVSDTSDNSVFSEKDFEKYLDNALQNVTENEQDLSLAIIKFNNISSDVLISLKEILLNVTTLDNIFKRENNSIALIIFDNDIDEAVIKAQNIYNEIKEALLKQNCDINFAIGLSSKSLRIVSPARLINEAEQAVERAFNEIELPIVAFKVNPDKYREHISNI